MSSACLLAAACAADPADPSGAEPSDPEVSSSSVSALCGDAMPGPALTPGGIESDAAIAQLLGSIDPSRAPNPTGFGGDAPITRSIVNYMLGRSAGTSVTHAEALARGGLGRTVLASAVNASSTGALDLKLLRYGLWRFYTCETPLPRTLTELVARYGDYTTWASFDIDCSRAKGGPRRFYEDRSRGVYVAETLVDGAVRETEVIFSSLRRDGQLDFAAYTERGELTNRSTFATGATTSATLAAPFTCMTCHVDRETGSFSKRFPVGVGAGCPGPGP